MSDAAVRKAKRARTCGCPSRRVCAQCVTAIRQAREEGMTPHELSMSILARQMRED